MSRPRFLADHDLNEQIVTGVLRREPALECVRARDVGMSERSDAEMFILGLPLLNVQLICDVDADDARPPYPRGGSGDHHSFAQPGPHCLPRPLWGRGEIREGGAKP